MRTRVTVCDECKETPAIMTIEIANGLEGFRLQTDVCSWACLIKLAKGAKAQEEKI